MQRLAWKVKWYAHILNLGILALLKEPSFNLLNELSPLSSLVNCFGGKSPHAQDAQLNVNRIIARADGEPLMAWSAVHSPLRQWPQMGAFAQAPRSAPSTGERENDAGQH